jgi:fatty-acyl-CoA synthase
MEVPLTPLEFARRTRTLYPDREVVVDGTLRLTYSQFFDRCDRWSAALHRLGVGVGDRIAYIAPNTHAQLESFYAVPQIGAILVPINYRLTPDDFAYIITHSGSTVVCAHADYLEAVDRVRGALTGGRTSLRSKARATVGSTTSRWSATSRLGSTTLRSARTTSSPSTTRAARRHGPRA